jgi:orotate phosphoribosyltransferase
MKEEEIMAILNETGAIQAGHFLLSSGLHSDQYIQCAKVFQYPKYAARVANALVDNFRLDRPAIVVGIALGGIILAHEVARSIGARAIFAERIDGKLTLRRGFDIRHRERVLLVEDVLTTGSSILELKNLVKEYEPLIVGVGAFIDRSKDFKIRNKYVYLLKYKLQTYEPKDCPLCKKEIPVVKPGSR